MGKAIKITADSVVSSFLSGAGTLYDLAREAAIDNSLTPEEIEHLAQSVNREAQVRMYAEKGPNGIFNFDLVQPEKIIDSLNVDYDAPKEVKTASAKFNPHPKETLKFAESEGENYSGRYEPRSHAIWKGAEKMRVEESEIQERMAKLAMDMDKEIQGIRRILKDNLVAEEATPDEILRIVQDNASDVEVKIASGILQSIVDEDVYLQAKLPKSMIVHKDPVITEKIIGPQALIKGLNTLVKQHESYECEGERLYRIREHIKYVVSDIQTNLRSTGSL